MAQNLNLVLRITGDASGLKAEIAGAKREVDALGSTGAAAGQQAAGGLGRTRSAASGAKSEIGAAKREVEGLGTSGAAAGQQAAGGMEILAGSAGRVVGALAALGGGAASIMAVARAGDRANAAIGRLAVATGSAAAALDVYGRLYDLSLRTGVSVDEAAGAFQRFAIAAREAGATQAQILSIVQIMQQAGALAGADTQATAAASMQLGQALASGRLQGDELRSILEVMPNLAEALARELGVGMGELRKLGEEGKLSADVVIPALQRGAARMNEEFQKLPPSLERSMGVLRQAMGRFLADMDRAAGLSQVIARAAGNEGLAGVVDRARRQMGFGSEVETAEIDVERRRSAAIQARRANDVAQSNLATLGPRPSPRDPVVQQAEASRAALAEAERAQIEAEQRLAALRGDADAREEAGDAANAPRGAANRRRQSEAEITELREALDRRLAVRREAAEREQRIARGLAAGVLDADAAAQLRRDSATREREQLAALDRRPGPSASAPTRPPREDEALRRARDDGARLAESLRTPLETLNDETARYSDLLARGAISQETFNRALARAQAQYDRTRPRTDAEREAEAMRRTFDDLGRLGERAFDRVGQSITQALAQGQLDFRRLNQVGLAVASELTQAFMQLAVLNPIRNALGLGGGNATTLMDAGNALARWFSGSGGAPSTAGIDASLASMTGVPFHTGGIVGREVGGMPRAVPATLFTTAPRYHAGRLAPDEVPAILRRDEGVFTPEQMARLGPAGGSYTFAPTVHFSGNAGSDDDRNRFMAQMQAMWRSDLLSAVPGIVGAAQGAIRADVQRRGASRALGMTA